MAVRGNTPREISDALRSAGSGGGGGGFTPITNADDAVAEGINYQLTVGGETFFVYFNGMTVLRAEPAIAIRYASDLVNLQNDGSADSAVGFSSNPFDNSGDRLLYRGTAFFDTIQAPTNAASYTWSESGANAIQVVIESSGATVFKNNSGSTTLTAVVYVGGLPQTATQIAQYTYSWKYANDPVCVLSGNNQLQDDSGSPQRASGDPATCPTGQELATSKTILVGAEDVTTSVQLTCDVSDIPN